MEVSSKVEAHARSILQARIAFAIRREMARYDLAAGREVEVIHKGDPARVGWEKFMFWGLAIAVFDDATWDALAQVRQSHILSRDLDIDVQLGEPMTDAEVLP